MFNKTKKVSNLYEADQKYSRKHKSKKKTDSQILIFRIQWNWKNEESYELRKNNISKKQVFYQNILHWLSQPKIVYQTKSFIRKEKRNLIEKCWIMSYSFLN